MLYIHSISNISVVLKFLIIISSYILTLIESFLVVVIGIFTAALGYFFMLILLINESFSSFYKWLKSLTDKRILSISTKFAVIFSLAFSVIINRYYPIFRDYAASTPAFEFTASAIIIPLIFEWIYSIRNRKYK